MLALAESMVAAVVGSNQLKLKESELMLNKAGAAALNLKLGKEEEERGSHQKKRRLLNCGAFY